ncbi:MAG TPA: PAS domain-containing protein [Anaeromyxobacteraceae bacterium]|nr:PAS domain-containing protein [Anaeromyxobacteraceae bacterium]
MSPEEDIHGTPPASLAFEVLEHGEGLFVLDRDYRIVFVNQAFEKAARMARAEVLGRIFWEVFPDAARPETKYSQEYRRAMRDRVEVRFEEYYAPNEVWTSVSVYPTRFGGIAVFFRDATLQKRAEARAEFLARLPKENPDPVLRVGADLVILYANPAAESAFAALGVRVGATTPAQLHDAARDALQDGARRRMELIGCSTCWTRASRCSTAPSRPAPGRSAPGACLTSACPSRAGSADSASLEPRSPI